VLGGAVVRLRAVCALVAGDLSRAADLMWRATPALAVYQAWLRVSYDLIRGTAPLLADALSECLRRDDEVCATLADYYAEQWAQERGHDTWLLEDMAVAGAFPHEVPSPVAARLAGAQHYWLRNAHPVALLGHIAMLEWHTPSARLAPMLMQRTGLPESAFRTLIRHVELDEGHAALLDDLLERLKLNDALQRLVTTSAITTADGMVELMTTLGRARWTDG
jgi:hypothetical protein